MIKFIFYLLLFCLYAIQGKTQDATSVLSNIEGIPEDYYGRVDKKISSIDKQLSKKSAKYLAKFQRRDNKFRKKLRKLNPESIIADRDEKYKEFFKKINIPSTSKGFIKIRVLLSNKSPPAKNEENANSPITGEYNPYLDSLNTSLSFLNQFKGTSHKVESPLANLHSLKNKFQQSEKVKEFIAERKNQLKEALSKFTKIPPDLKSQYDKLGKTAYYYSAQVKEYKEMLKDPKKIEQKTLAALNRLPAFQKFMKENGQLASLFRINENVDPAQALAGLQTRSSIQGIIQQRISSGGPNAMQIVQQNIAQATNELNTLKDKINQVGGGSSDLEMPDLSASQASFKPNSQRIKPFLKRLEYSANIQFEKSNRLLPSAANIGLGIGYKLNDKGAIGIGSSYKIGMGTIQHISFTSQGLGLRSYFDWKIKKQIYASGGYEMNYNVTFKNIEQLKNYEAWQRSALIGVTKKYKISKKLKGEMKLLYDFLANQHIPVTQTVLFRIGYIL